jgi:zinc transport system substrate-binding protein
MTRIHNANPEMKIIALHKGVPLREVDRFATISQEKGLKDPHTWTSPLLVQFMASRIRDALIAEDPVHRADYAANCTRFIADLGELDRYIRTRLRGMKGGSFMVFHPSWGYFADTYGLHQIPIESGGKEPGARSLQQVIEVGKRKGVKVIFVQQQFSNRTAESVAHALGARVVPVDPLSEDYLKNLRHVADIFAEALHN